MMKEVTCGSCGASSFHRVGCPVLARRRSIARRVAIPGGAILLLVAVVARNDSMTEGLSAGLLGALAASLLAVITLKIYNRARQRDADPKDLDVARPVRSDDIE
jgi:hypothetical protein